MGFAQVLELAGKYTLARILERDDFTNRFRDNQPIAMQELFYPLMQGYDSVALNADIEVGGSAQTFNLLVGRPSAQLRAGSPVRLSLSLRPALTCREDEQVTGNYIGRAEPADIMYEKCMKVPDSLLGDYFRLTPGLPCEEYAELIGSDIRRAHLLYAETITGMYHDRASADKAKARYLSVAIGGIPENIEERVFPALLRCGTRFDGGLANQASEEEAISGMAALRSTGIKAADPAVLITVGKHRAEKRQIAFVSVVRKSYN
jgi:tyrosyl-tRNA synthetase